ncbi:MAG: MASE1 domain-containing protein [Planctomycetota bacterium]|nr:MASE1 domain-containing protein [Planctomycetota bacterium]
MALLALGYVALSWLGLRFAVIDSQISPVWPAAGLALGVMLRWGWRLWPGVFVGAFVINVMLGGPVSAAVMAAGNTGSALMAIALLRHARFRANLPSPRDVLLFSILGGGSATMVAATVGVVTGTLSKGAPWDQATMSWVTWWLGDCIGVLLLGPVVLLVPLRRAQWPSVKIPELVLALLTGLGVSVTVFWIAGDRAESPLSFLLWPVLAWSALRLGRVVTSLAILLAAIIAITGSVRGFGVFGGFADLNHEWVVLQAYLVSSAVPVLVLCAAVDQLRGAQQHLRLTQHGIDSAADGVVWLDPRGNLVQANEAFAELMRGPLSALLGHHFNDTCVRMDHEQWQKLLTMVAERGRAVRQIDLLAFDGNRVPAELSATAVVEDDATYTCLILRDLRDRQVFEEHLYQTQKMEAIGRLADGIAHDFNNMLAAIYGNAELLQMQMESRGDDCRYINNIVLTCERARELTNQLMVFSRKNRDKPQIVDLVQLVQQAVELNRRVIPESIGIEHQPHYEILLIEADPARISQLVMNLMLNARDAMPGGGRIHIATEAVTIDETRAAKWPDATAGTFHRLSVDDSGVGISSDALAHIFEPFFTTKEAGSGTGLGLAIVHGIAHSAGGFVSVESAKGRGTRFEVYLPAATGPREHTTSGRLSTSAISRIGAGKHALLVEDDERVLELVREVLERSGFSVDVATNGKDGLLAVDHKAGGYDLVVTDLVMPDLGGVDMATGIRERAGTLPVLFMSGYGDNEVTGTNEDGMAPNCAFIGKPFTIGDFTETVRGLMNPKPKL